MSRKLAYWISIAVLCLLYIVSATFYLTQPDLVRELLGHLGYPAYLVPVLIVVKLGGVAGMLYHLQLALSAHLAAHDEAGTPPALIGLVLLAVSWLKQNAARATPSPYAPSPFSQHAV